LIRLGAGRSQVQILSPRLRTRSRQEDSSSLRKQQKSPLLRPNPAPRTA
jgi:hypothetical protein